MTNDLQISHSEKLLVLKKLLDFLSQNLDSHTPVLNYKKAQELEQELKLSISPQGEDFQHLVEQLDQFLQYSVRTGHKYFFNQLYSAVSWPALLGEILAVITNSSMATYEVSPLGTIVEKFLIDKMKNLVGFHQGEGIFVTGGSNANLVALLCARNAKFPQFKEQGFAACNSLIPVIFVSEEAHYSYLKAANCVGLGTKNVIKVASDQQGRMIPEELELKIKEIREQGFFPFFIGATAGTTVTGSFDPLDALSAIARRYDLWLHVDGAYGGSFLLSEHHRHLFSGLSLADSFAWDAHKLMAVPLVCSVILFKEKGRLFQGQSGGGAEYLFHDYENQDYDLGPLSLQCGRRIDAFKLWMSWKFFGDQGHHQRINYLVQLAEVAERYVLNHPRLKLIVPRQSLNICFQYQLPRQTHFSPPSSSSSSSSLGTDFNWNDLNLRIRQKLVTEGKYMVNYSYWKGVLVIRTVYLNPHLAMEEVPLLYEAIVEIGDQFMQELGHHL